MDTVTLENFRCFREEQTARLAPLTLLVGENSTGKTSFLALIRAIWNLAYRYRIPDFKEEPYDLGSFDEIAHHRGARGGRADEFHAGFSAKGSKRRSTATRFVFTFGKNGTVPVPTRRRIARGRIWIDESYRGADSYMLKVGRNRHSWQVPDSISISYGHEGDFALPPYFFLLGRIGESEPFVNLDLVPQGDSPPFSSSDRKRIRNLAELSEVGFHSQQPFASAPVRSRPHRTYDPSRPTPDPEGDYIPMYLANTFSRNRAIWSDLKKGLEDFGQAAGLFDEISIRRFGESGGDPFQLQVRRFDGRRMGPQRNLIDVGYGVSQVLPVVTELLRPDASPLFLLQQPEVHLHPSAQAALGSLFCRVASPDRQLIVETHSDHLLDRVRMEVRDGESNLKPEDVSILYFERGDLDVNIHSIRIDEMGNILGAPDGYRRFFLEEADARCELSRVCDCRRKRRPRGVRLQPVASGGWLPRVDHERKWTTRCRRRGA